MKFKVIEGISNFNDTLRQDILEFFEKEWKECTRKRKAGFWALEKTYVNKTTGKKLYLRVGIEAKRLKASTDSHITTRQMGNTIYSWIKINLTHIDNDYKGVLRQYHNLLSTLEHEITHISQKINKSLTRARKNISYADYNKLHHTIPTEKEANLVSLFSQIKNRPPKEALRFFDEHWAYWKDIGFGYKTFLKKAADYGLTNKELAPFIQELRKWGKRRQVNLPMLDFKYYPRQT
jgi:hypothetical protein